jgi:hypothetical protein
MKLTSFAATAIAVALLSAGSVMADETLKTGDSHSMDKWYGRAGGPVGADRIEAIGKATGDHVGISYDQDVAKRTNMPREGAGKNDIGITYDKDVAARTNMQRDVPPTQSAGTPASPRN